MRTIGLTTCGLVAALLAGCGGGSAGEGEGVGYVLLDTGARASGYALEENGTKRQPLTPIPVAEDALAVVGRDGRVPLSVVPGDVLVVGSQGELVERHLGSEVDPDRFWIDADDPTAHGLAERLGLELSAAEGAGWILAGRDALATVADAEVSAGVSAFSLIDVAPLDHEAAEPPGGGPERIAILEAPGARVEGRPHHAAELAALERMASVRCKDPIAGVWLARLYDERFDVWDNFTLNVRRVAGTDELVGTIVNDTWSGNGASLDAPRAEGESGAEHHRVAMTAKGTIEAGAVRFGGTSWRIERTLLGRASGYDYNLDQFTGITSGGVFEAVNNDGGRMRDAPASFRRTACR